MKIGRIIAVLALVAGATSAAGAQTATQTVNIEVTAINVISVSGVVSLTVGAAVAGSQPTSVTSAVSSWAVTTNQTGAKITASLDAAMPAGLTLSADLTAPAGATSAGPTALGVAAADVVTGITKLAAGALGLTYQLDATVAAGVVAATSRTVTYTITGGV